MLAVDIGEDGVVDHPDGLVIIVTVTDFDIEGRPL